MRSGFFVFLLLGINADPMPIIVLPELATTVPVLPGESLLNALITAKINAPYDCMAGHCGECRAQVLAGRANPLYAGDEVQSLSPADRDKGYLLLCQSVINPADESISIALSPQKKADDEPHGAG
jgi:ferredoxin